MIERIVIVSVELRAVSGSPQATADRLHAELGVRGLRKADIQFELIRRRRVDGLYEGRLLARGGTS